MVRGVECGSRDLFDRGDDMRKFIELTLYDENERKAFIFVDAIQGIFEEYDKDRETPYTSVMVGGTPCWVKESTGEILTRMEEGFGVVW